MLTMMLFDSAIILAIVAMAIWFTNAFGIDWLEADTPFFISSLVVIFLTPILAITGVAKGLVAFIMAVIYILELLQ